MTHAAPAATLATAQQQARRQLFVGREQELEAFRELVTAGDTPRIVYIDGPGGIGKSSLLHRFQDIAENAGQAFARLDARLVSTAPASVRHAVDQALPDIDGDRRRVLAIDHAEQWSALDGWLRTELIPELPADLILVIASREPPTTEWRVDPGFSALLSNYELAPLSNAEAMVYLERRAVSPDRRAEVMTFSRGNPLALALASDHALRTSAGSMEPAMDEDVFTTVVQWLLRDIDDPQHRLAVAACATVRLLDQPLLENMLVSERPDALYDWLATQNFIDRQPGGLVIHDLIRDVVIHDLRSRDVDKHQNLIRRAADHYLNGLDQHTPLPLAAQRVGAIIYALRYEPYVQQMFPFGDASHYVDNAADAESQALADEVERLEGGESRGCFEYWAAQERSQILVARDRKGAPAALAVLLHFSAGDIAERHDDPAVHKWFNALRRNAPLRGGEKAMLTRFMMAHETHQAGSPAYATLTAELNGFAFLPGMTVMGFPTDMTYDWSPIGDNALAQRFLDTEYHAGARRFIINWQDLRIEPPLEWARNSVERILRQGDTPELQPTPPALLDWPEFKEAVCEALRSFNSDSAIANSPLIRSPMLRRFARHRTPETLRSLMRQTSADRLDRMEAPGGDHQILEAVYFHPASKLQAVALDLHISERTLRRRIRDAELRLAEALWRTDTLAE